MLKIATNLEEGTLNGGEFRAGATDLSARIRLGIRPDQITDINGLEELKGIDWKENGAATIGALVKIDALSKEPNIMHHYPALAQAAGGLATPQIRSVATVGGSLLQSTRCWYYRNPAFHCYKKGGDHCPAREGNHQFGVCFDLGPCVFPHPSTIGMALLAYGAEVEIANKGLRSIADIYGDGSDPSRDHLLASDELLTSIHMPPPLSEEKSVYFRAISRFEAEWPLVEVVARLKIDGGLVTFAKIAVGGVANIPFELPSVAGTLTGQPANPGTFKQAASKAVEGANPLPMTAYKVKLLQGSVLEALKGCLS